MFLRRSFLILGFSSLFICSCSGNYVNEKGEGTDKSLETNTSLIAEDKNKEIAIGEANNDDSWIDAYYEKIKNISGETTYLQFVDVDFDGIPELFLCHTGTGGSYIHSGYSFKDGSVLDIVTPGLATDLTLYRDRLTKELLWIANGVFKSGGGTSRYYRWHQVDFTDFSDVKQTFFFEWEQHWNHEDNLDTYISQVMDCHGNATIVHSNEIPMLIDEQFAAYEQVDVVQLGSSVWDLRSEEEDSNVLNQELFTVFAQLYDETIEHNLAVEEENPDSLPIYNIRNYNTNHNEQTSEYQLSMIQNEYTRKDHDADISVSYLQLSRFHDTEIQRELNVQLKAFALSDWDVKTEEEVELQITQWPSIYQNYLSIKKQLDIIFMMPPIRGVKSLQ